MKWPKVVEFMGLPNAGKTSHIEKLTRSLATEGISTRFIQDQIRDAPIKDDEVEKNRWAIRETGNLIAVAKEQDWGLILIERGGWAYVASLTAFLRNGKYKGKKQRKKIRQALRLALDLAQDGDFFILIEISSDIALERDQQLGVTQPGKIINPASLSVLESAYQDIRKRLPYHRTRFINGENDFQKNHNKMFKALLSLRKGEVNDNKKEAKPEKTKAIS